MKFIIVSAFLISAILWSCTKDVGSLPVIVFDDAALYKLVSNSSSLTTWKSLISNPDSIFTSDAFHGTKQYKLRVNAKALTAMTDGGKLPVNGVFPDSSLIVKHLYNASNQIEMYAVLYKKDGTWLWTEFGPTGNVVLGMNGDASACKGCHTSTRDHLWTFDSH